MKSLVVWSSFLWIYLFTNTLFVDAISAKDMYEREYNKIMAIDYEEELKKELEKPLSEGRNLLLNGNVTISGNETLDNETRIDPIHIELDVSYKNGHDGQPMVVRVNCRSPTSTSLFNYSMPVQSKPFLEKSICEVTVEEALGLVIIFFVLLMVLLCIGICCCSSKNQPEVTPVAFAVRNSDP